MLQLSMLELFLRVIPECLGYILCIYAFSHVVIDKKQFAISGTILSAIVFGVRCLPITYGIHTILIIIALIVLTTNINKINIIKSIRAAIIGVVIQFIAEGINVFLIQYILRQELQVVFSDPRSKIIYGMPSLGILIISGMIYYLWAKRRKKLQYV